jgi:F0F1-type ATP synthase assembly protein I
MTDKARVLDEIVAAAKANDISKEEFAEAYDRQPGLEAATAQNQKSAVLTRVLAYLGGTFVFAGLGVFIAMNWESMNFAARVVITLGSGIAAFVLALIAVNDERYEKAATPLFLIAALLQPAGLLVIFEEFYRGDEWDTIGLITSGAMAAQQVMTLLKTQRTTLLFTGIIFVTIFVLILFDKIGVDYDTSALIVGASILSLSAGLNGTKHEVITPFWYFVGSMWLLFGVFSLIQDSAIEILFIAVASGLVYISTVVRSRTLLFVSTIAMLSYIGYFSAKHFVQSIGWPIALVLFGLLLIGMSAMAFKINKKYITASAVGPSAE